MSKHEWFEVVFNNEKWKILAVDHEDAATEFAETYENENQDFSIAEGTKKERVKVRKVDEKEWKNFVVTGEIIANYRAREG
jgi:hypothetical protein